MNFTIQSKIPYALFVVIILPMLGFAGIASSQDNATYIMQTHDHLCTGAFLKSSGISYTVLPDELPFYAHFHQSPTDVCESCTTIMIDIPYHEFLDSLWPALRERTEFFGVEEVPLQGGLPAPQDVFWSINNYAIKPVGGFPPCVFELDPILNNIVRNMLGSPDHDSIPAPYDHANPEDLIGVIISTREPLRMQEYLAQNDAVTLSTAVLDGYASMEAFVPVSLLIPFVERHPGVEVKAMVVGKHAIIHTGDWYYSLGDRSVWRTDVEPPNWYIIPDGNVGIINVNADRTMVGDELLTGTPRCYYTDGLDPPYEESCEGNIDSRTVEILMNLNPRAKLYVVDTNLSHIVSTANWLFDKGVDTIHIIDDVETLTVTISPAYLVHATEPSSSSNHDPILDIDDVTISQRDDAVSHWFSIQDDDLDDRLIFAAESSNRSIATIDVHNLGLASLPSLESLENLESPPSLEDLLGQLRAPGIPSYDNTVRTHYVDIFPHSAGMTKITVSVTDGASVVTDTFVVTVTDNTAPKLEIDRARFSVVVGEARDVTPVAVDPDGDTLSYEILEPAGGLGSVSVSVSNDTMTLTPIAEGQDDIEIMVSDGKGGHDHASFRVCVAALNSPPRISPLPSHITIPVNADTMSIEVVATDADGDEIFLASIIRSNYTVASIEYHYPEFSAIDFGYHHIQPCAPRSELDKRYETLLITPKTVGNTTATIEVQDAWGGLDFATIQVTVYEPTASGYD